MAGETLTLKHLKNSSFTFSEIGAGASDALKRMGVAYDIVTSLFDIAFRLPSYQNYHSPELDFLEVFGLRTAFNGAIAGETARPSRRERISSLIERFETSGVELEDGLDYIFVPDVYDSDVIFKEFKKRFIVEPKFLGYLSYTPLQHVFLPRAGSKKVVVHLRRQDIIGFALFSGLRDEDIPNSLRKWVQSRETLSIERAVKEVEQIFEPGASVQMVITSDGVAETRRRIWKSPLLNERLDAIEAELYDQPISELLDIQVVDRIIGTGPVETRKSLDAMYEADLVVTASSSFPGVVCRIGKVPLKVVELQPN
jgi:hypothetical protein